MKGDIIMPPITRSQLPVSVPSPPTIAKHRPKQPKIADNSKPDLSSLPGDLKNMIFNSADLFTGVSLSKTSREYNNLFKKIWKNKQENPDLTQKHERKYPYLHLIAKPSLQEAIVHYNQQIKNYSFLTEFEFEDELSNKDLWGKINKVLEAFAYKVDKKIDFYTFCLSFHKLAENAAEALINLAANPENRVLVIKAGAIEPLVKLLDGADRQKWIAAGALMILAINNPDNQKAILEAGAIEPLVKLLDGTNTQKENAAGALWNLANNNPDNQKAIIEAGAIEPLVTLLKEGENTQKRYAAGVLKNLASNNPDNQKAFEEIKRLVTLVMKGSDRQKENAARALRNFKWIQSI